MPTLPVTVIIVTHNSAEVIAACLASVPEAARVIVVDNASSDDSCNFIKNNFPQVELIQNAENLGFGHANNLALMQVKTPFALLLNPDAVMQQGALHSLLEGAKTTPDAAILAPRITDEHGETQHTYKQAIFIRETAKNIHTPMAEGDVCAEFLSGAVMLLNMVHMQKVGFFDPAIFLYYEDDDLCLRVRQAGLGLVWLHKAMAMHLCGKSSPPTPALLYFKNRHLIWSRIYLEQKYHGKKAGTVLALKLTALYGLKALSYGLLLRTEKAWRSYARMRGALSFFSAPQVSSP